MLANIQMKPVGQIELVTRHDNPIHENIHMMWNERQKAWIKPVVFMSFGTMTVTEI